MPQKGTKMTWDKYRSAANAGNLLASFDAMVELGMRPVINGECPKTGKIKVPIGAKEWGNEPIENRRKRLAAYIEQGVPVGIGCQPDGYIVLDIDPPGKNRSNLPTAWKESASLLLGGEDWPRTTIVGTQAGCHVWFKTTPEIAESWQDRGKLELPLPSGGKVEFFTGNKKQIQVACPPSEGKDFKNSESPCEIPQSTASVILEILNPKPIENAVEMPCKLTGPATPFVIKWFEDRLHKLTASVMNAAEGDRHDTYRKSVRTIAGYAAGMNLESMASTVYTMLTSAHREAKPEVTNYVLDATFRWAWERGIAQPLIDPMVEQLKWQDNSSVILVAERAKESRPDITPYHDPFKVARMFQEYQLSHRILNWKGSYYQYTGGRYQEIRNEELKAKIGSFSDHWYLVNAENEFARLDDPKAKASFRKRPVNAGVIQSVTQAFLSVSTVDETRLASMPGWIDRMSDDWKPSETLALADCLLNVRTGEVKALTNRWFSRVRSPIRWNGGVADCPNWLAFLESAFPNDPDSIRMLQQYMGLCLTNDTSFQKILAMIGPPRSGKGTISRVFLGMLGNDSIVSLAMSDLSREFGLERLIGVPVAIMPDVRFGNRDNVADAIERLLTISGEDEIRIARKYQSDWCGKLPTRIVMASNEMPRLPDAAAAMPTRLLTLQFTESHLGKEDLDLQPRLMAELPGIMAWCCEGYRDLIECGAFARNDATIRTAEEAQEVGSPVLSFMRDCLDVTYQLDHSVEIGELFSLYQTWCERTGHRAASQSTLTKQIMDLEPKIRKARPGSRESSRRRRMVGVQILGDARMNLSTY